MRRRVLVAAWLLVGAAVWNGFFDLYVSGGEREYLQLRAEFDAGLGPAPVMTDVMDRAVRHGLLAASLWAVLVAGLGLATLRLAAGGRGSRPPGRTGAPSPPTGKA